MQRLELLANFTELAWNSKENASSSYYTFASRKADARLFRCHLSQIEPVLVCVFFWWFINLRDRLC